MATKDSFKYIAQFVSQDGISGYEEPIAKVYQTITSKAGAQVSRDGFGSVIAAFGNPKGFKIMLAAHMDEVGFLVQQIEKSGFLRMQPVGGHWPHVLLSNRVKVVTTSGKVFPGVIGSTSVHVLQPEARGKVVDFKDIYVDLGFDSDAEVRKAGIDVGDQIINVAEVVALANDKYVAKAIDNRIGVAIIAKVVETLAKTAVPAHVFAVATAQEEVGLRGAKAATQHINPDVAIAIDTTVSHDTPGILSGDTKLGKGVAITMMDHTAIANPKLANFLFDLAQKHKIPTYKFVSQGGGNDSGVTQYSKSGIPVVTISIPTRYLHTPSEVGSTKDFEAVVALLVAFLQEFDAKAYAMTKY